MPVYIIPLSFLPSSVLDARLDVGCPLRRYALHPRPYHPRAWFSLPMIATRSINASCGLYEGRQAVNLSLDVNTAVRTTPHARRDFWNNVDLLGENCGTAVWRQELQV